MNEYASVSYVKDGSDDCLCGTESKDKRDEGIYESIDELLDEWMDRWRHF